MSGIIETPCGRIQGTTCQWEGVDAFQGIRYATANRWEYPQLVTHWDGVYDASRYGACSYQPRAFYDEAAMPEKAFYYNEFRKGESYTYSEDCLFLNIWVPHTAQPGGKLPVVFYIHGGGFTGGCGHEKHFDGPIWAAKGVIAVTCNYRLGPMGFAALPELEDETGAAGNYGLYDQVAALQWVQQNISAFGGDPANVTLMGQSAGAMSVQQLCISPLTDGLFAKAVMSSGGGANKLMPDVTTSQMYPVWQAIQQAAGCATLEEFKALEPQKLFEVWNTVKAANKMAGMACFPGIDGKIIPFGVNKAVELGRQKNIPYILGSNSEDMVPPIFYGMVMDWCKGQSAAGMAPSYAYHFSRQLPGDEEGAWHSADLWYWFGTLDNCWRPMIGKDKALSQEMSDYLVNFAKNSNPNGENLPRWEAVTQAQGNVLCFGEGDTVMGQPDMAKLQWNMEHRHPVGE